MVTTAQLFGWIVTYYNVPTILAEAIQSVSSSSLVFLFLTLVILLIAGMFMEALSVVIIVAPILHPVALLYGIDPIFFGFFVVFVMCIESHLHPSALVCLSVAVCPTGLSSEWQKRYCLLFWLRFWWQSLLFSCRKLSHSCPI